MGTISGNKWSGFYVHGTMEKMEALKIPVSPQFSRRRWLGQWDRTQRQLPRQGMPADLISTLVAIVVGWFGVGELD